jgi:hypothetical protein
MKDLIISILNKHKETYKLGSDGEYDAYKAVGEEDFNLVAAEIIQSLQTEWVSVEDRLPTLEENGEKVLIHRLMNDSQKLLAYSVHDTKMVKYCDKDTFWKTLTPPNR